VTLCIYNVSFNLIVYRRFIPVSDGYDSGNFFTVQNGARIATPLLLALAVIELSDVVFAVDSVPAVGLPTFTHGMARWGTSKTLLPRVPALAVVELSNVVSAVGLVPAVRFHREPHLGNVCQLDASERAGGRCVCCRLSASVGP